jgi:hypothetical protein
VPLHQHTRGQIILVISLHLVEKMLELLDETTVHWAMSYVSDRTSGVAAEGWKEAPDAGKVPRLGQPDRQGAGAGYGEEEKDEE